MDDPVVSTYHQVMQIIMQQSECVISTHLQYLQIEQKICIAYSLLNIRSEFLSQGHRSDISMTDSCYGAGRHLRI